MTIQQLFYVIAITKAGSMNKAAENLFISQPTLTKSIKELENEIGFTVFARSGKRVTAKRNSESLHSIIHLP